MKKFPNSRKHGEKRRDLEAVGKTKSQGNAHRGKREVRTPISKNKESLRSISTEYTRLERFVKGGESEIKKGCRTGKGPRRRRKKQRTWLVQEDHEGKGARQGRGRNHARSENSMRERGRQFKCLISV